MKRQSKIHSFLEGVASISIFPRPLSDPFEGKSDEELCREDWYVIGQDIKQAASLVGENIHYGKHRGKAAKA